MDARLRRRSANSRDSVGRVKGLDLSRIGLHYRRSHYSSGGSSGQPGDRQPGAGIWLIGAGMSVCRATREWPRVLGKGMSAVPQRACRRWSDRFRAQTTCGPRGLEARLDEPSRSSPTHSHDPATRVDPRRQATTARHVPASCGAAPSVRQPTTSPRQSCRNCSSGENPSSCRARRVKRAAPALTQQHAGGWCRAFRSSARPVL
jgi:hypothetical protein